MTTESKKVMYEGKLVEVIDCTPTWQRILPTMIFCYENLLKVKRPTQEQIEALEKIKHEFKRMAIFADKYVESQKES